MKNDKKNYSADDYKNGNCIVKEARLVIDDYIKRHDCKLKVGCARGDELTGKKKNKAKLAISPFVLFNLVVFILITTFLYVLSKAI